MPTILKPDMALGTSSGNNMAGSSHSSSTKGRQFRISLPNDEGEDTGVQRGGAILFQKYRTQLQSREAAETTEFSSLCASGVQTGQNVLDDSQEDQDELNGYQPRPKKRKQTDAVTQKKWAWKDEFVVSLIAYIKEYKAVCDFNGVDFEADLKDLYTELHRCLASRFPEDFGPDKVSEPSTAVKDMSCEEYDLYKKTTAEEKIQIAKVYDRIKAKVKSIRQDYRTAVNKGTRSGSGKLVKEHFDILREIWGGSPATTMLAEGVDGDSLLSDKVKSSSEGKTSMTGTKGSHNNNNNSNNNNNNNNNNSNNNNNNNNNNNDNDNKNKLHTHK